MSKLDDLLMELCPDGVEYKILGDVATISRGGNFQKKDFCESGVPCIHYGQIYTKYGMFPTETFTYIDSNMAEKQKFAEPGDIVMAVTSENIEDICKCIAWLGNEKAAISGHSAIIHHSLNPKYLVYYLHSSMFYQQKTKLAHGTKVMEVRPDDLKGIRLPVPPLEVQREIVRVLDSFTLLLDELTDELTARKKQYEYYRNMIIDQDKYKLVRLGDIATVVRGGNFQKKDFVELGRPCIHYGQMYTHFGIYANSILKYIPEEVFNKSKIASRNDIVMAVTSENVEDVCSCTAWLGDEDIAVSGHTAIIKHEQNAKYLSYYFHTDHFFKQKTKLAHGTKVIEVTPSALCDIVIPLPTIEEQNRIVAILDRFDNLCHDIVSGIPSEIGNRRKQYEYYRDKLLAFKELES